VADGETLVTAQRAFTTEAPRHGEEQPQKSRSNLEIFSVSLCLRGEKLLFEDAVV
jgi:hypothetical protein